MHQSGEIFDVVEVTSGRIKIRNPEDGMVDVLPHSAHPSADIETVLSNKLYELEQGTITPAKFRENMRGFTQPKYLSKLSQPMRRMLYEIGAL